MLWNTFFINVLWILKAVLDAAVESTENIRTGLAVAVSVQTGEQHALHSDMGMRRGGVGGPMKTKYSPYKQ